MSLSVQRVAEAQCPLQANTIYLECEPGQRPGFAVFLCPCGCGSTLRIPLDLADRPMWRLEREHPIHINPSVNIQGSCKAHFFIHDGQFRMC